MRSRRCAVTKPKGFGKLFDWWKEDAIELGFEVVLQSGRFGRCGRITTIEFLIGMNQPNIPLILMLMHLSCTIDGEKLPLQQWADMDIEESFPLAKHLNNRLDALSKMAGVS